jgi:hypothetical protein
MTMTRPSTVLLLYHRPTQWRFKDAATVREHIHSFKRHSRFPVVEVNTEYGFPPGLEDAEPGAVLLHYSIFGSGNYRLDERFLSWLRERRSTVKVTFFQDEFYFCQKRFAFVNDCGIDVVFTHVAPKHIPDVWGRYTPGARAVFNLPGYVDDRLLTAARRFARPETARDIDVGYRGRALPPHMGAGSQEKRVIGERFRELAAGRGLRLDIRTAEADRIYGNDWYSFLGRCHATLGVESGVSFMDLEDECHGEYLRLTEQGHEPSLEELQAGALGRWDGNMPYRTLGPRHLEAAAFRICQVLFEGEYSGAMEPMVHYIPLAKDFGNLDEVLELLEDPQRRRRIVDRAHADLIASGRYSYASFIRQVDESLVQAGLEPAPARRERASMIRATRNHKVRVEVKTRGRRSLDLAMYVVWRVAAPISLRIRRLLGLPVPSSR